MSTTYADRRKGPKSRWARRIVALEVGEHFTAPLAERNLIANLAHQWGGKLGRTFKTTRISDVTLRASRVA